MSRRLPVRAIEARARCGQQHLQIQAERARQRRLEAGHGAVGKPCQRTQRVRADAGIAPSTCRPSRICAVPSSHR